MVEPKAYFYETETEWILGAEGKVNVIGLPSISCGAPPDFHGRAGPLVAGTAFCRFTEQLFHAHLSRRCQACRRGSGQLFFDGDRQAGGGQGLPLSDYRNYRAAADRHRLGQRSLSDAGYSGASKGGLLHFELHQKRNQNSAGNLSPADAGIALPLGTNAGVNVAISVRPDLWGKIVAPEEFRGDKCDLTFLHPSAATVPNFNKLL